MKFRVHYTSPKLKGEQTAEISAEDKAVAEARFKHNCPDGRISRIAELGDARPRPPVVTLTEEDRPITEEDRTQVKQGFASLREQLRRVEPPKGKSSPIAPSMEMRDKS